MDPKKYFVLFALLFFSLNNAYSSEVASKNCQTALLVGRELKFGDGHYLPIQLSDGPAGLDRVSDFVQELADETSNFPEEIIDAIKRIKSDEPLTLAELKTKVEAELNSSSPVRSAESPGQPTRAPASSAASPPHSSVDYESVSDAWKELRRRCSP